MNLQSLLGMLVSSQENSSLSRLFGIGQLALGILIVLLLTLHLHGANFQRYLNSDFLIAHMFAQDLLNGAYPLDGWTFGSATFLFPDYFIFVPLVAIFGGSGLSYLVYAFSITLSMGAAMGFAFNRVSNLGLLSAYGLGYVVLGFILLMQFLPGHELTVYRLVVPAYHGSCQVLGILIVGILFETVYENRPLSGAERTVLLSLGSLGALSNTLLITQYLLPWLTTLAVLAYLGRNNFKGHLFRHALLVGLVVCAVLAFRALLAVTDFWEHARVFREYPLPWLIWEKLVLFFTDFIAETGPQLWSCWLLLAMLGPLAIRGLRAIRKNEDPLDRWVVVVIFVSVSVVSAIGLTIASLYWKNFQATRYFLNLLVLPAFALSSFVVTLNWVSYRWVRYARVCGLLSSAGVIAFGVLARVDLKEDLGFNYPAPVEEFDRLVAENNLSLGLSDYWRGHLFNTLSESDVSLNQVRTEGSPYFWCNNAYWYFGPEGPGEKAALTFPEYDFVLMNGLDEALIRQRYGEPETVLEGDYNRIFVYRGSSDGIRSALVPRIAEHLQGKSLAVSTD